MTHPDQVSFVSGATRLYGIVGHPIEQVRSPEMVTAELHKRGLNALMAPVHVRPDDFEALVPALMRLGNLDGLVFTVPYKVRAVAFADGLGPNAAAAGAINVLARRADRRWIGEMLDGVGCVDGFRRHGAPLAGRRIMLVGAGGAGTAIAVAAAFERPAHLRLYDIDGARATSLAERVRRVAPDVPVEVGEPVADGMDALINASPTGMLGDPRLPIAAESLPRSLVVLDAVTKPEETPLLALARRSGCLAIPGREMMRGQIPRIVDHFLGG